MKDTRLQETLKAGLFNGLIIQGNDLYGIIEGIDTPIIPNLRHEEYESEAKYIAECPINGWGGYSFPVSKVKPHLFPLSMLTKPIRIEGYNDGKEFVPITWIYENCSQGHEDILEACIDDNRWVESLPKYMHDYLTSMRFNVFNLDEDQYINASESKVYEPKQKG